MVSTALPQPGASPPTFCHGNNLAQRQRDRRAAGRAPGCPKQRRARMGGSRAPQQPALSSDPTQFPRAQSPHRVPMNPHRRKGGWNRGDHVQRGDNRGGLRPPAALGRHRIRVRVRCGRRGAGRQNALHKRPQACAAGVRPLMAPPRSAQPRDCPARHAWHAQGSNACAASVECKRSYAKPRATESASAPRRGASSGAPGSARGPTISLLYLNACRHVWRER